MRAPKARLYATCESAEGAIVCDTPQPARQGRYILLVNYKAEKPSVHLSDRRGHISAMSVWINAGLALRDSYVLRY